MKKFLFNTMAIASVVIIIIFYYGTALLMNFANENFAKEQLVSEVEVYKMFFNELDSEYFGDIDDKYDGTVHVIFAKDILKYKEKDVLDAVQNGTGFTVSSSDKHLKYYYSEILESGDILRVSADAQSFFEQMVELLPWAFLCMIILLLLVDIFCENLTKIMSNKINSINVKKPTESKLYDELDPLVSAIEKRQQVTAQRKAMLAQKQTEFDVIIENMAEGLIIINEKADVLSANKSAIIMCGDSAYFQSGNSVYLLNRDLNFFAAVEKALAGEKTEYKNTVSGKTYRFFLNPVEIDTQACGAVIVIMDVTETESRESLRREFAANVSHELKTPLTSISGYAELIKTGIAKSEDIPGFAEKIYTEAQRMINLVSDIIKVSRLDEGDVSLKKEKCDLYEISKDILGRVENTANNKGVSVDLTGENISIIGVKPILEEMIYNLCENGIKYNKKGGKVNINVVRLDQKAIVSVSDDGVGIPQADQNRIFERFYRVDKSHSRETGGTGLGLSIVKHGARLNGGEIHLSSEVGKGTNITIEFDISE